MTTATKVTENSYDFPLYINTGTADSPVWTLVDGLQELSMDPQPTKKDTSRYSQAGSGSETTTMLKYNVTTKGERLIDAASKTQDPGQAAVEALGRGTGANALGEYLIPLGASDEAAHFFADTNVTTYGGPTDGVAPFNINLSVNGPVEYIAKPATL